VISPLSRLWGRRGRRSQPFDIDELTGETLRVVREFTGNKAVEPRRMCRRYNRSVTATATDFLSTYIDPIAEDLTFQQAEKILAI
jgi:hypothetical protein